MNASITFSSILEEGYREELEELMFFNPQQKKAISGISRSITEYGVPNIFLDNERLRVKVDGLAESQTLYALADADDKPDLVGVMVFSRTDPENIVLLHIAVKEEYSRFGKHANEMLVARFMTQLRDIAKRIRGVNHITLKYAGGLRIPVQ